MPKGFKYLYFIPQWVLDHPDLAPVAKDMIDRGEAVLIEPLPEDKRKEELRLRQFWEC